jgi:hypothetical protein
MLIAAFEDTSRVLRLVDRSDPAVVMVAKRVTSATRSGRDPASPGHGRHAPTFAGSRNFSILGGPELNDE